MTTREMRLGQVRCEAHRVLAEFGVTGARDIHLEQIAAAHGAEVVLDDLDGATARVIQLKDRARIYISSRILDPGSIRFSLAHELAHLLLRHHLQHGEAHRVLERICSPLRADGTNREREASVFASELLMPAPMVQEHCIAAPTSLAPIYTIAREFRVSVLAAAMRFVEMTTERCAIVYTELGHVRWCKRSATFGAWIPRGRPVDPSVAAFDYFDRGVIDHASRVTSPGAWLGRSANDGAIASIVEHPTIVPELGAVFSLLWVPTDAPAPVAPAA